RRPGYRLHVASKSPESGYRKIETSSSFAPCAISVKVSTHYLDGFSGGLQVQALSHHNTAFHQLLKPVSRHEFEALAREHHQGQKLRRASRWDQFLGMTMSQLSGRQSLRDIESNLQDRKSVGEGKRVQRCDR